jgi:ArsR family transcriptional regulator
MEDLLKIFSALGNDSRFRIAMMLRYKNMCVCEIRNVIGSSMSTISNHLKILKEAKIISSYKDDKYVTYFLNKESEYFREILKILEKTEDDILLKDKEIVVKTKRINVC